MYVVLLCNSFHAMYSVNVREYTVENNECILCCERWVVQEKRPTVCIGNLNIDQFLGPSVWTFPDDLPFYSNLASFPSIFQTKYVRPGPRKYSFFSFHSNLVSFFVRFSKWKVAHDNIRSQKITFFRWNKFSRIIITVLCYYDSFLLFFLLSKLCIVLTKYPWPPVLTEGKTPVSCIRKAGEKVLSGQLIAQKCVNLG